MKAFEITQNTPLSTKRLKEKSTKSVFNSTDSLYKYRLSDSPDFTIYEGDWGKPYAARFELWFVPENGRQERKLIEKIYKIEGWQR